MIFYIFICFYYYVLTLLFYNFFTFSFFSYARGYHAPDLFKVFIAYVASVETGLLLPSLPSPFKRLSAGRLEYSLDFDQV